MQLTKVTVKLIRDVITNSNMIGQRSCFLMISLIYLNVELPLSESLEVNLLDTTKLESLDWWSFSETSRSRRGQWKEASHTTNEGEVNRVYTICNMSPDPPETWLITPFIPREYATNRLYVEVKFSMRKCTKTTIPLSAGALRVNQCKESFKLLYRESQSTDVISSLPITASSSSSTTTSTANDLVFRHVDVLAADRMFTDIAEAVENIETRSIAFNEQHQQARYHNSQSQRHMDPSSGVHFAFVDAGACMTLLSVRVYFIVCPSTTMRYAFFPQTSPGQELSSVVVVSGKCIENSSPDESQEVTALCKSDGTWHYKDGACLCVPGFQPQTRRETNIPYSNIKYLNFYFKSNKKSVDDDTVTFQKRLKNKFILDIDESHVLNNNTSFEGAEDIDYEHFHMASDDDDEEDEMIRLNKEDEGQDDRCVECPKNFYKSESGPELCLSCPNNSEAEGWGASECLCIHGYYKSSDEGASHSCTKPPSSVQNLSISQVSHNDVNITWSPPLHNGGRSDLYYKVECLYCGSEIKVWPNSVGFNSTWVLISNLIVNKQYTVSISAMNGVSYVAYEQHGTISNYANITFITGTQPSSSSSSRTSVKNDDDLTKRHPIRVVSVGANFITLCWDSFNSSSSSGKDMYDMIYELTWSQSESSSSSSSSSSLHKISPFNDDHDRQLNESVKTRSAQISVKNLIADSAYSFKLRYFHKNEWSPYTRTLTVRTNTYNYEIYTSETKFGLVAGSVGGIVACLIIFVFVIIFFIRRSQKQRLEKVACDGSNCNTATMPIYKTSSSIKTYVDPHTYEDPTLAVRDFTMEIDPQRVQIESIIGEGEFGSVCRGHLKPPISVVATLPPHSFSGKSTTDLSLNHGGMSSLIGEEDSTRNTKQRDYLTKFSTSRLAKTSRNNSSTDESELHHTSAAGITVAVKSLKTGSTEKNRLDFLAEASIMGQFNDPNVVKLVGVVSMGATPMIITEYVENGALDRFLRQNDGVFTVFQLVGIIRGIASGMKYLSEMGYVHRDLAARNILISSNLVCKICDFGLSREIENFEVDGAFTARGGKIPIRWTAPEAIAYRKFTTASDVWSYGVVTWEVMSYGERPYWNWSNRDVIEAIENGFRLPPPMECPECIYYLMLSCWDNDRSSRPKFASIVLAIDKLIRNSELLNVMAVPRPVDLLNFDSYKRSTTLDNRKFTNSSQENLQRQQQRRRQHHDFNIFHQQKIIDNPPSYQPLQRPQQNCDVIGQILTDEYDSQQQFFQQQQIYHHYLQHQNIRHSPIPQALPSSEFRGHNNQSLTSKRQPKVHATSKHSSVGDWLVGVGLEKYCDRFAEYGFEELDQACDVTSRHLEEMGVVDICERNRILNAAIILKATSKYQLRRNNSTLLMN